MDFISVQPGQLKGAVKVAGKGPGKGAVRALCIFAELCTMHPRPHLLPDHLTGSYLLSINLYFFLSLFQIAAQFGKNLSKNPKKRQNSK